MMQDVVHVGLNHMWNTDQWPWDIQYCTVWYGLTEGIRVCIGQLALYLLPYFMVNEVLCVFVFHFEQINDELIMLNGDRS